MVCYTYCLSCLSSPSTRCKRAQAATWHCAVVSRVMYQTSLERVHVCMVDKTLMGGPTELKSNMFVEWLVANKVISYDKVKQATKNIITTFIYAPTSILSHCHYCVTVNLKMYCVM